MLLENTMCVGSRQYSKVSNSSLFYQSFDDVADHHALEVEGGSTAQHATIKQTASTPVAAALTHLFVDVVDLMDCCCRSPCTTTSCC
jgi:hypothetical protein